MTPFLLPKLFLASGALGALLGTLPISTDSTVDNHTLAGEKIAPSQVVTRSRWGTPMLPDGKGGYSLIAPINQKFIEQSLWIPPISGTRPAPVVVVQAVVPATTVTQPLPLPEVPTPSAATAPATQ